MNSEPKLTIIDSFIDAADQLFSDLVASVIWDDRLRARKTASVGVSYDYSGMSYAKVEMHEKLVPLCRLIEKTVGFYPNNCLLNYYLDGESSMGFHSDATEDLQAGTGVVIISLGAERVIAYRNKVNKALEHHYPLKNGCFLYMDQQVQHEWLHAIPKQQHAAARISLTFRLIKPRQTTQ